jgi:hypothetical protein
MNYQMSNRKNLFKNSNKPQDGFPTALLPLTLANLLSKTTAEEILNPLMVV